MKELYREVIRINQMEDNFDKEETARIFFERLNAMVLPSRFNWAKEIFEDLHVKETPDKTALVWYDIHTLETRSYSYLGLLQKANQLINFLAKQGMGHGNNYYMMCPILPETWISSLACIKAGMVAVPTATTMTPRELEFRFETYRPDVVMADEASADLMDQAAKETGIEPRVKLVLGKKQGWISFDQIQNESMEAGAADTAADETLFCFFTSGTTGLPKRVGHTAVSYPVGHLSTTIMAGVKPDDIHHNLSAPGWAKWSWSSFFVPFNVGATATGFRFSVLDGEQYLDALSRNCVTTFCGPPTAWRMFVNMNLDSFDLTHLRQSISAGEPLNPEVITRWKKHTGTEIRDFYGQTESTAMIGNPPWMAGKMRSGSFGMPSPMYDVALADDEGNQITTPDQVGHIVLKLDQWRPIGLFSEYIGNPEKMSSVFVDNFYYTGDRASFDSDGYWWFVGRADDVIKSSDYRIGPFEVESALVEHPAVAEAAVVGAPDPNRYQLVKAYVILNPTYEGNRDLALELFKHTMNILAKFKIPRIIEFVTEVPKTISGKIRRIELREMTINKKEADVMDEMKEYFYWDFPELSSKNKK
ncbi:MAG: AMP-binding protein [Proteobacteria bacterium]|nr:AMP-binding protein [Desulfobacula sp.]MBU3954048.1 AMP-binding protein [Pseudomonadota bacterium]MBU4133171.1 AMP-binding protein [Pseudomonadota bacterium]